MVVACRSNHGAEQAAPAGDCADDGGAKYEKLSVSMRCVGRREQIALGGLSKRPVEVFSGAIYAAERLFVYEAHKTVFPGDAAKHHHGEGLVVGRDVRAFEERRNFVLAWRDFVVARFGRYAELEKLVFNLRHV